MTAPKPVRLTRAERKRQLLAQAGYPNGFSTELWAMPVSRPYVPNGRRAAAMIQADWAKIGVQALIVTYEWGEYLKRTRDGEIPCSASSALTSRVPMLLVPLTPIFLLVSRAMVVIGEPAAVTSTRVSGRSVEASARMRNLAPAACAEM